MKKPVTFTIDENIVDRLRALSKETHIPQAKLASMAIDEFITKKEKEMKKLKELNLLNFQENEVRSLNGNSEAWINLNDVCRMLDVKKPRDTKSRLKHDGVVSTDVIDNLGRVQSA